MTAPPSVIPAASCHPARRLSSPVGQLTLVAGAHGLAAVLWENDDPRRAPLGPLCFAQTHPVLDQAGAQLDAYFAGRRTVFDLPLDPVGTPFQKAVWAALMTIPFGETRSYGQLAAQVGSPKGARAVGAANGRNPISIITPCHRAIGASGALTGFAGGLEAKRFLLELEGRQRTLI
ncbi:methylated-DNA--[protein]-cysteine S-methyltransferase [Xanthobacteraceae bacterium A53D]